MRCVKSFVGGLSKGALGPALLFVLSFVFAASAWAVAAMWSPAGSLTTARYTNSVTLLASGKVLVAGGNNGSFLSSAELYNPATNTWGSGGTLATARSRHAASLLGTGNVLVAGGYNGSYLASAQLYNSLTNTWSATGPLAAPRADHTANRLQSGSVLVTGGIDSSGNALARTEIYNPGPGTWSVVAPLATARTGHTATVLASGKVLVVGGYDGITLTSAFAGAELYDPAADTWAPAGTLTTARINHTATVLPSGKVLVVGGIDSGSSYLASAEIYDPATNTWAPAGALANARAFHTASLLASGRVLAAAGSNGGTFLASAEIYDPATDTWSATGALATARTRHVAVVLNSGNVLVAGGATSVSIIASAELYDPGIQTTTNLVSSANPSQFGASVSFTATVSGQSPTGTVTFKDGATAVCSAVALSGGSAVCATSALSPGAHAITAVYSGDATNTPSTSNVVAQQVDHVVLTSSVNPSTYNQTVVFTATVYGPAPTGAIVFIGDGTSISFCSPVFLSGGSASCSQSGLTVGAHTISAMYFSSSSDPSGNSNVLTQQVNQSATSTALSSATNPSTFGQNVTFTATVSGQAVSGTVTFSDGAFTLCSAVTLSGGSASCQTPVFLTAGVHSISAVYSGDAINSGSTSNTLMQQVDQASTSTSLDSTPNPSALGESVTFFASVSGLASTGTVTFNDGATTICAAATVQSGIASCSTSALSLGAHSISAVYSGDDNHFASTSNSVTQQVDPAPTSTALASSTNPSMLSQSVTFTASVTGSFSPSGTVTFKDGAGTICAAVVMNSGSAACSTSALSVGAHSITAVYSGDTNNATSTSNTVTQQVNPFVSSTALSSATNPSAFAQSVTFTATVSGQAPTGTVTFSDGATAICSAVALNSGSAQCAISTLSVASHSITAVYSGDTNNTTSTSNTVTQQVNPAATSTSVTSDFNPVKFQAPVTFTATVTGHSPTGTLTFSDGATPICSAVTLNSGSAQCVISTLSVGAHPITAVYSGDTNNATSTSPVYTQQVNKNPTTTSLATSCMTTFVENQPFTMAASVSGAAPTGSVSFATQDNTVLCANVPLNAGSANCTTSTLNVAGSAAAQAYVLTASYSGDVANATSTSAEIMVTALKASDVVFRSGLESESPSCPIQ